MNNFLLCTLERFGILAQLALVIFFGVFLCVLKQENWIALTVFLGLISVFPFYRMKLSAIFTVIGWFILGYSPIPSASSIALGQGFTLSHPFLMEFGAVLLVFIFSVGAINFFQLFPTRFSSLIIFSFYFLLLTLISYFVPNGALSVLIWIFVWALGKFICYLLVSVSKETKPMAAILQVSFFLPFWSHYAWPMPIDLQRLCESEARDQSEFYRVQLSGFKLLIWSLVLAFLYDCLRYFFFNVPPGISGIFFIKKLPHFSLPTVYEIGFNEFNKLKLSAKFYWVDLILSGFRYPLLAAAKAGICVSIARMAGFNLFRSTYKPYQAKNFADLLKRLGFYYNELLVRIFFYPIWGFLRPVHRYKSLRLWFTIFLTIGMGGFLLHIFSRMYFLQDGPLLIEFKEKYLITLPYFVTLAFAVASSNIGRKYMPNFLYTGNYHLIRLTGIYLLYAIIMTNAVFMKNTRFVDRVEYCERLVGLNEH